jgi:ABC-type transport system involved in cytochrome c biogenesis permease component
VWIFLAILVVLNAKDSVLVEVSVSAHLLAMMQMLALMIPAPKELEEMDVFTAKLAAMTMMLAPTISVLQALDVDIPM